MYLRNSWHVAAWSREVGDKPVARTMLGKAVVVYRTQSGAVFALQDRCLHRQSPLSKGVAVGETLQGGYHGMTFDGTGACVSIPRETAIPPRARVRAYPVTERYGWVWVSIGAPTLIANFFATLTDPKFGKVGKTNHVRASYRLVKNNLMDLSHVGFVHTTTIGNAAFGAKGQLTVTRAERGVDAMRLVPDVPPPPTHVRSGWLPAGRNNDRWSRMEFVVPCFMFIHTGGAEVGTGALEGNYEHRLSLCLLNARTPETEKTTNYSLGSVRSHAVCITRRTGRSRSGGDAASIKSRRVLARLIARATAGDLAATRAAAE